MVIGIPLPCSTTPHCYTYLNLVPPFFQYISWSFSCSMVLDVVVYSIGICEIVDHHSLLYYIIIVNSSLDTSIMNISLSRGQRTHCVHYVSQIYTSGPGFPTSQSKQTYNLFTPRYSWNIATFGTKHQPTNQPPNQPTNQPTNATLHIVVLLIKWVQLRWEAIVCFAEIGTIADHHCLNFLFIIIIIINYKRLWRNKHCGQLMIYIGNHVPR